MQRVRLGVGGSGCRGSLRDRMANDILPERFVYDTSQLNSLLSLIGGITCLNRKVDKSSTRC